MTPDTIATMLNAGPWVVTGFIIWQVARSVNSRQWLHRHEHESTVEILNRIIEDKDRSIDRLERITSGAIHIVEQESPRKGAGYD